MREPKRESLSLPPRMARIRPRKCKCLVAQFLKKVEDMCMPNKKAAFAALMAIAQDQQGCFTTKQALQAGYADNTHSYHVRCGNWKRVWRGIYRIPHLPAPEDGEMMVWLLWSRGRDEQPCAAISHQSALSLFELGDFSPAKVHLTVPPAFRRNSQLPKTVVLHRAVLVSADVTSLRGLTVCRPLRALCDLASQDPETVGDLHPVAAEARRRGLITGPEIEAMKARQTTRKLLAALLP
jgi:predicted transcriptional regulator of viral defense system